MGLVHDEKLESPSSESRNDPHPELIPVGMRGFAVEPDAAADDVYE